jgi:copper oxidase (laccase) domain-containing protein
LRRAGLSAIELTDEDTYSQPEKYFSYRRTCHKGEKDYGRQISVVRIKSKDEKD